MDTNTLLAVIALPMLAIGAWRLRLQWIASHLASVLEAWQARRSAGGVGIASRRELQHLPSRLEELVVEAQRIRRGLLPLRPLREESRWALWDWLRRVQAVERCDPYGLARIEVRSATLCGGLAAAWAEPRRHRVQHRGRSMPAWIHQLIVIDEELWTFIRAAALPSRSAYR